MEDLTGRQFGPYRVVAALGQGGMASIYTAFQPAVNRHIALKVLSRYFTTDPQFFERFRHEAAIVAQLQHPHILPVFDFGESDGYAYLAMPFIEGGTLAAALTGKPVALEFAERVIRQIGDALDYAHSKGIVHRDIKPSNVLMDLRGNCVLADFGIARITEGATRLTSTGALIGTPEYMSPEQAAGEKVGPASDIYSLGIVLFQMLTGAVPYHAETPIAVAIKHVSAPLPLPRTSNPSLSPQIEAVILKALARSPGDRYASAVDLASALTAAVQAAQQLQGMATFIVPPQERAAAEEAVASAPVEASPPAEAPPTRPAPRAAPPPRPPPVVSVHQEREPRPIERPDASEVYEPQAVATTRRVWPWVAGVTAVFLVALYPFIPPSESAKAKIEQDACLSHPAESCVSIGIRYRYGGAGVPQSDKTAADLYRKACDAGSNTGCVFLAEMYEKGIGVTADAAQAIGLYRSACDGRDNSACEALKRFGNQAGVFPKPPPPAPVRDDRTPPASRLSAAVLQGTWTARCVKDGEEIRSSLSLVFSARTATYRERYYKDSPDCSAAPYQDLQSTSTIRFDPSTFRILGREANAAQKQLIRRAVADGYTVIGSAVTETKAFAGAYEQDPVGQESVMLIKVDGRKLLILGGEKGDAPGVLTKQ